MIREIQVGDRVQYSAKFLKSIGACTGWICFAAGVVTDIERYGGTAIAYIAWENISRMPIAANIENLVPVDQKHLEPV
jgi:hypothetical protein